MKITLPYDIIVAHGHENYRFLSSAAVQSVMESIGAPHRVRQVLDYTSLFDALKTTEATPIVISDPRSLPSLTVFSETPPIEDFVTTFMEYLWEDNSNHGVLLFWEDEMERLPGAEQVFEQRMSWRNSQYKIFRESGSMLRRSTVLALILKVLQEK